MGPTSEYVMWNVSKGALCSMTSHVTGWWSWWTYFWSPTKGLQKQTKLHLCFIQDFTVKLAQRHLNEWHNFKNVVIFHVTTDISHFLLAHHPHQLIPMWNIIQVVQVFMTFTSYVNLSDYERIYAIFHQGSGTAHNSMHFLETVFWRQRIVAYWTARSKPKQLSLVGYVKG
jgi:hypothetical protein